MLWICDPGFLFARSGDDGDEGLAGMFGKGLHQETRSPRVVKVTLDGEIRDGLPRPPQNPDYPGSPMGDYCPCGTAVDEERCRRQRGCLGSRWIRQQPGTPLRQDRALRVHPERHRRSRSVRTAHTPCT